MDLTADNKPFSKIVSDIFMWHQSLYILLHVKCCVSGIETVHKSVLAAMTKEERVQRDLEQMPKKRCTSDEEEHQAKQDINKVLTSGEAEGK